MSRRTFVIIAIVMVAVAAAVRIQNAFAFSPLRGYDGFGHFTYIWYMSETWSVPRPTSGWSFFHPPLYYALMAALWTALDGVDSLLRLNFAALLMGILSLTHAAVSYVIVRRYFPGERLIHLLAPGLMLVLPVNVYSAPFLSNEGLGAVLCSVSLLALLAVLARPSLTRSVALGLCLGLAMLTKFSGLVVVLGAFAALALQALVRRRVAAGLLTLAAVATVMLSVCGWYYARNMSLYGTPFKLSRDEFMVRHIENFQTKGTRGLLEYVLFDPIIFRRPQWPRGLPLAGEVPQTAVRSPIRESVWTGIYANAWFDGQGGWILPKVTESELSRRAGQALLCLGLVPTLVIILGVATAITTLRRRGWDDTLAAMLLTFAAMVATFVSGTRVITMHAAIKATYFMSVTVVFSFWFALGLRRLADMNRRWLRFVVAESAVLAIVSCAVFTQGLLFKPLLPAEDSAFRPEWDNLQGVVYYAGGERGRARAAFQLAASRDWYLAHENLAAIVFQEGRPLEALYHLRNAARIEPSQSIGNPADRKHFDMITQAEYSNSMAVIYHDLGWRDDALRAAAEAVAKDATLPEAYYNLGVLKLLRATGAESAEGKPPSRLDVIGVRQARTNFERAFTFDPGFLPAAAMLGVTEAMLGNCEQAEANIVKIVDPPPGLRREFPAETGRGIWQAASIGRRKYIEQLPEELEPRRWLAACRAPGQSARR